MRILALDFGEKRIGLALTDPLGFSAHPFETITRGDSLAEDINRIISVVRDRSVGEVVVGYPKGLREQITPQTRKVMEFIETLKISLNIPIVEWDERLSTKAAERQLKQMELRGKKKKAKVDQLAACFILEGYLQRKNRK